MHIIKISNSGGLVTKQEKCGESFISIRQCWCSFSALQPDPKQVSQKAVRNSEFTETYASALRACCVLLKCISGFLMCYLLSDGTIWTTISQIYSVLTWLWKLNKKKKDLKGLRSQGGILLQWGSLVKMYFVSFNTLLCLTDLGRCYGWASGRAPSST